MTVIFYSVSGEGMGHATRSEVMIDHLLSLGHTLVIFSYDRAYSYLAKTFGERKGVAAVIEITGINFVYEKNEFKIGKTILKEYRKARGFIFRNAQIYSDMIVRYSPSLMITDYEPASSVIARLLKIPLICIDNVNLISKCSLDPRFDKFIEVKFLDYLKTFEGDYNFIPSIFNLPVKEKRKHNTCLMGPIIRKAICERRSSIKDFILVYQTSTSYDQLFEILKRTDENYIVYGFGKSERDNNLLFKLPSKEEFADDLASCKAVITNGGFTLISEAVFLGKPIYSIPIRNQREQEINAFYIKRYGFGTYSEKIDGITLTNFLSNLQNYRQNIKDAELQINDFARFDEKASLLSENYKIPTSTSMLIRIKSSADRYGQKYERYFRRLVTRLHRERKKLRKFRKRAGMKIEEMKKAILQ